MNARLVTACSIVTIAVVSLATGEAHAAPLLKCQPFAATVVHPAPAFTEYVHEVKNDPRAFGEVRDGPDGIALDAKGQVWAELGITKGLVTVFDGNYLLCVVDPYGDKVRNDASLLQQATGATAPALEGLTASVALPKGGVFASHAVATDGSTWLTISYQGKLGNPTNAGTLAHLDTSHHLRIYTIPGDNDVGGDPLVIARDGTIWLASYYSDRLIAIDPEKLAP